MSLSLEVIVEEAVTELVVVDGGEIEAVAIERETTVVEVGVVGPQGPRGLAGEGAGFEQSFAAASSWLVNHNLGRLPIVTLLRTGDAEIEAEVVHTSLNQFVVYFALPVAGRVRCL